ncbi:MAG: hypothetical protein Q4D82_00045 [Neisseria sp.]|nr:hypothetical protein [Neisseria sp.]
MERLIQSSPSAGAAERSGILAEKSVPVFEQREAVRVERAAKMLRSEGSLRSKPATAVAFLCLLSLAKQRK